MRLWDAIMGAVVLVAALLAGAQLLRAEIPHPAQVPASAAAG